MKVQKKVIYEDGKGMRFQMRLRVQECDGKVEVAEGVTRVTDASTATLSFNVQQLVIMDLIRILIVDGKEYKAHMCRKY